jgi:hypothetical protein
VRAHDILEDPDEQGSYIMKMFLHHFFARENLVKEDNCGVEA